MKSCKQCDEYDVCSRQNDLRRKKPRCPKAKIDKPMTNYDLLISKTPEEMAELIAKWAFCDECVELFGYKVCETMNCSDHWLSWLKSPVEVDNGT